jgi:hypothetical protein
MESTCSAAVDFGKRMMPAIRKPDESRIIHAAREIFIGMLKIAAIGSALGGVAILATGGAPALMAVTGIFLAIFSHKLAACLPEKIAKQAEFIFKAIGVIITGSSLYALSGYVITRVAFSAVAFLVLDHLAGRRHFVTIESKSLNGEIIDKKLKESTSPIMKLTIRQEVGEEPFTITQEIADKILEYKPQIIAFENCNFDESSFSQLSGNYGDIVNYVFSHPIKESK